MLTLIRAGDHEGADAQLRELHRKNTTTVRVAIQPRVLYHDPVSDRSRYTWWKGVHWTYDLEPADAYEFRLMLAELFARVGAYGIQEVRNRLTIALPMRVRER